MPPNRKNRGRSIESLGRRGPTQSAKKLTYIFCEGETEEKYFDYLKHHPEIDLATAVITKVHGGSPIGVVREACQKKDELKKDKSSLPEDTVWAIFDTERLADNTSFFKAVNMARDNKIQLVISNPCIEYWFLLHFEKTNRAFYNCQEAVHTIKAKFPDYQKGKNIEISKYFPLEKIKEAVKCAQKFYEELPDAEQYVTTSTSVYRLVLHLFEIAGIEL